MPSDYTLHFSYDIYYRWLSVTKHIFNTDDNYEFIVEMRNDDDYKYLIIDENGKIIKNLSNCPNYSSYYPTVFFDEKSNKNKLIISQVNKQDYLDIY